MTQELDLRYDKSLIRLRLTGLQVFVVATETSTTRFSPFLIRSYDESHAMSSSTILRTMDFMQSCNGTSAATLWEACRATSAAPTYFSSFDLGMLCAFKFLQFFVCTEDLSQSYALPKHERTPTLVPDDPSGIGSG